MEWQYGSKPAWDVASSDRQFAESLGNSFNWDNVSNLVESIRQWGCDLRDHLKLLKGVSNMGRRVRTFLLVLAIACAPLLAVWQLPRLALGEQISRDSSRFEWGPSKGSFAISLALPTSVSQNQVIEATFALKYDGPGSVSIERNFAYSDYTIRVVDQSGNPVPRRTDTLIGSSYSAGGNTLTLSSGEVQSERVDIAVLYKLTHGKYTLVASRVIRSPDGRDLTTLLSQPVKIDVL